MGVSSIVLVVFKHFEAFGSEGAAEVPLPDRGVSLSLAIATHLCPGLEGRKRLKAGGMTLYDQTKAEYMMDSTVATDNAMNTRMKSCQIHV